jgi:hypothetical protein
VQGAFFNRFGWGLRNNGRDEIKLDLLKIQKKIDVKKLKHQLWTVINPMVEEAPGKSE